MSTQGDPSTSGGGPDRPCGITSLLPVGMSCRGRAEAFARSLQSRLRTLGAQGNADDEVPITGGSGSSSGYNADNTWLSQEESAAVTSSQPVRLVTNEAADSCFDFDMENESPGSPVEECEYTRLIETATATPAEIAPESGYVCASPCSTPQVSQEEHSPSSTGSSSDCQFYDPVESSDAEQRCDYFDCTTSEPSSGSGSAIARLTSSSRTQHHNTTTSTESTATTAATVVAADPASSPTTSRRRKQHQNGHLPSGLGTAADSDSCSESLPPSQSTESHDSTFTGLSSNNSNSTLQDVTLEGMMEETTTTTSKPESSAVDETDDGKVLANGHAVMPKGTIMHEESTVAKFELNQTYNIDVLKFINGDAEEEPDEEDPNSPKVEMAEVEKMLQEAEQKEAASSSSEHKREGLSSGDEDEDLCRPQRIRRCSSLKTGKTPPGTPGRKKIVRFADVLGLDLADVKTFVDEVPKVPKQAYEDLEINIEPVQTQICLGPRADRVLVPLFQQPGALPCFLDRVREKQVNLENAAVTDPINLTITGTVRVRNLDFHKSVYIRYTTDNWRSFSDLQASYVDNSCDGFSDKFTFTIYGTSVQIGQRIEMAARFHCRGQQFWDNNYDTNYVFQCLPITQPNNLALPSVKPANLNDALLSPDEAWCKSFY